MQIETPETEERRTFIDKVLIAVGVSLAAAALAAILYFALDILLLSFAAILFAVFLRGLGNGLRRFVNIGEVPSVLVSTVLVIGVMGGAIALLSPSVAEQAKELRADLPRSADQAADYISQFGWGRAMLSQMPTTDDVVNMVTTSSFLTNVGGVFSSTVGMIGNFFIGILLAIYLATEPNFYINGFIKLFTKNRRGRIREVFDAIGETLQWWLIGKAGSMLFIALLTWIGLALMGIELALTLGLIAGLLSFIPNFGPILSAVPALLLAFIDRPIKAVWVLALYVGVQIIESNIVTPIIERETVELPPALTVIFQLVLTVTIGGLGLVLATPLLAVVMVIVQMLYIQDVLGDTNTEAAKNLETEGPVEAGGPAEADGAADQADEEL